MSVETAAALARFAHVGASLFLFGALAFALYARAHALTRRIEVALALVSLLAGCAWVAAMAQAIGGPALWTQPTLIETLLFRTSFGPAWLVHLALTALMLALSALGASRRAHAGAALMTAQLASFSWIGHAAASEGTEATVLMSAHALHLQAAGVWLGGALALLIRLRQLGDGAASQTLLRRFSRVGYGAVAVLALAGFVNLRLVAHGWLPDTQTAYGQLMALKLALAAGVACIAAFNRLYASAPGRRALLYRAIIAEHGFFLAILFAAASLSALSPHG